MRRHFEKEIMDDFTITDERIDSALDELKIINKYLGGCSASRDGINKLILNPAGTRSHSVLDVGAGGSENLNFDKTENENLNITSLDINERACYYTRNNIRGGQVVCGNALFMPFKESSFDIVHASLFLHHFTEDEIIRLLEIFVQVSRLGVVINDLHRSIFAYGGIKFITALLSNSIMVKNDAPLSVKRGFVKREIVKIFCRSESLSFHIRYRWAFRWLVVIRKRAL